MIIQSSKENRFRTVTGRLIKNPDIRTFGEKHYSKASFALACEGREGRITNVQAVFDLADMCRDLAKGDWVMVVGSLSSFEGKDGEKRWYIDAESIFPDMRTMNRLEATKSTAAPIDISGFTELPDDEEEPF